MRLIWKFPKNFHGWITNVGLGIYCESYDHHARLPEFYSIFDAEITAIYLSLKFINDNNTVNALIVSDSKSSLEALTNLYTKHPIISRIQDYLINSKNKHNFVFC